MIFDEVEHQCHILDLLVGQMIVSLSFGWVEVSQIKNVALLWALGALLICIFPTKNLLGPSNQPTSKKSFKQISSRVSYLLQPPDFSNGQDPGCTFNAKRFSRRLRTSRIPSMENKKIPTTSLQLTVRPWKWGPPWKFGDSETGNPPIF